MSILYDPAANTLTLHTRCATYQMQVAPSGRLLHLYYGQKIEGECLDYNLIPVDRGFSPNDYDSRSARGVSPDTLPQEYPDSNSGDFRVPALQCLSSNGAPGTRLRYLRHEIRPGKYALQGLPASFASAEAADTLCVTMGDAATGLEVDLLYAAFEEADVITRAAVLRNTGSAPVRLDKAASLCLDLPAGKQWTLLHFHGRHCMERQPERVPLMHGMQSVLSRRGASSHHHNPFVALLEPAATETQGVCIGVMPVYSGNHRTDIEVDPYDSARVVSGINGEMFSWQLDPGEAFAAPEVALFYSDSGLEALSARCHRFLRDHMIRSPWNRRPRPALINNWEAMMFDFDQAKLIDFAREAAALGFEMVVLDDGWFGARDSDNAGLGDWQANPRKLPGGLRAYSDAVHGLGMKFGLWIEPEMVNEDSDLYRAHPDWALTVPGRAPVMGRNQLALDMGRPEVVDYLYRAFSRILREDGVDYIKWDMNRNITDVYSHILPPERQLEASHRYILGVYDLMERLTTGFPEVLFEGCAGGGGRFDAGMLYYMPQIWLSDDTDAIERLTIQQGTSVAYPASAMGAHVSVCPNQQTGRTTPIGTRAVVAMSGAFGYELDPAALTDAERAQVKAQIARYRRFRDLIHNGRIHRLTEIDALSDYTAWAFTAPDGARALLNVVTTRARANPPLIHTALRGLAPEGRYRIAEAVLEGCVVEGESARKQMETLRARTFSGQSLMRAGITLPPLEGDYPSAQLLFERIG